MVANYEPVYFLVKRIRHEFRSYHDNCTCIQQKSPTRTHLIGIARLGGAEGQMAVEKMSKSVAGRATE